MSFVEVVRLQFNLESFYIICAPYSKILSILPCAAITKTPTLINSMEAYQTATIQNEMASTGDRTRDLLHPKQESYL